MLSQLDNILHFFESLVSHRVVDVVHKTYIKCIIVDGVPLVMQHFLFNIYYIFLVYIVILFFLTSHMS